MIQKLTANLKKSQQYGKKVAEQLSLIGKQIMQTKIDCAKLMQKVDKASTHNEQMSMILKKHTEQSSNYQFKRQKLQIRLKQNERKLQIQKQIHERKLNYQQQLKKKVQAMEKDITKEDKFDQETIKYKQDIQQIDFKINKQLIQIQNLQYELITKNKQLRAKQDELCMKKKSNIKKKETLQKLQIMLNEQQNKQNKNINLDSFNQQCRIKELKTKNNESIKKISQKLAILIQMYENIDLMAEVNGQIREQVTKSGELLNQVKLQKIGLMKTKDILQGYKSM